MLRICLAIVLCIAAIGRADVVWIEAEAPLLTNFPSKHPFNPTDARERGLLSGAAWLGTDGRRAETAFAEYRLTTATAGKHFLYARKFWKHGPFRWRINDGPWQTVDKTVALLDRTELRKNVEANWVSLGKVRLEAGEHALRIELTENFGPAAFDCFVLTTAPFTPRGLLRPGQKLNRAPQGWFAFEPDEDPFKPSPIDLRYLNEAFAGEHGRLIARGDEIAHEQTGKPVRFWGVNARPDVVGLDRAALDRLARLLAKRGVNLVRVHMPIGDARGPDPKAIEKVQQFTAAMKAQGIYTAISIYFPVWLKLKPQDGFGSYNDAHPFGIVFFDPKFQAVYRSWFKALLTGDNPHGSPLGKEPAVALVEMVNEDSLFFWTFKPYDRVPSEQMATIERLFFDWLVQQHGSIDAARARWPGGAVRGDDFAAGRAGIMTLYDINQRKDTRAQDTGAFLADTQQSFFQQMQAFLRTDCGYDGLTIASNWVTADARTLGPLDKLSNTAADVMDRHGYYEGKHQGPRAAFAIDAGDTYFDRAAARFDRQEPVEAGKFSFNTPLFDFQYNGKPSVISEVNWPQPNRFAGEMPLLATAYSSLQGTDGFMFFTLLGPSWDAATAKFGLQTPVGLAQFPAAALAYRRGMIRPSEPVARIARTPAQLRALGGMPANTAGNLDALRSADLPEGAAAEVETLDQLDPRTPAVGRVDVVLNDNPGKSRLTDLSAFIDDADGRIRSSTGELLWNYGDGVVTINAPQVQAATGFLAAAGAVELADCVIESKNEFAAVWLIALDDQPIATSRRLLLQVMTEQKNYSFAAEGESKKTIKSLGEPPIVVKQFEGSVRLKQPIQSVTPLDANGYPAGAAQAADSTVTLLPEVMYYLLKR